MSQFPSHLTGDGEMRKGWEDRETYKGEGDGETHNGRDGKTHIFVTDRQRFIKRWCPPKKKFSFSNVSASTQNLRNGSILRTYLT